MASDLEVNLLTAFLYDLARDYLPVGKINRILMENKKLLPRGIVKYSDTRLAEWAKQAAVDLLAGKRYDL